MTSVTTPGKDLWGPSQGSLLTILVVVALAATGACARGGSDVGAELDPAHPSGKTVVRVTGLSPADLTGLVSDGGVAASGGPAVVVRVAGTADGMPPVAGTFAREGGDLVFVPRFPFDPGRSYTVEVDPARLPEPRSGGVRTFQVGLPAADERPVTVVSRVLPSGDVWPENTLRFYIEFSRPMSRTSGLDHVRLLDEHGREVIDPFLPLDVEFWNPGYTRYTFFFDPGRVKRDILPNRELGRALVADRSYTLEVSSDWRDAEGLPLAGPYRRTFRVGAADETPVDPAAWTIDRPRAGSRDALVVRFPESLDHGLLGRAVGLESPDGELVPGEVAIGEAERSWRFTPRDTWRAATYSLVVLSILEDPAGNRVGRPFEVDEFSRVDPSPTPERTTIPVVIAGGR